MTEYLRRLPAAARRVGSRDDGEIQLVIAADELEVARARREAEVRTNGLSPEASRLGVVFEDEYLLVVRDPVRFADGHFGTYLRVFEKSALDGASGVVLVPVRADDVLLRKVFRHATRAWETECPRGFREAGQTDAEAVRMEARQELGLPIVAVTHLGSVCANTGLFAGIAEAYCVEVAAGTPNPRPESREAFGPIEEVARPELARRIAAGEIRDGLTLSALMLAHTKGLVRLD